MMNRFVLLVQGILLSSSVLLMTTEARNHRNNNNKKWEEHAQVTGWDESFAAFVSYPPKALEGLPYEKVDELTTLTLDIVVNVAQWDQPLFAILKGIVNRNFRIKTTNHFFIQDGWIYNHTTGVTSECRRPVKKENPEVDADADAEIQYEPVGWENCTRHCTNGGRYCLNHLDIAGAPLVKESARRMCFDYYLEPGSTVLWDYMDRFETAGCRNDGVDMTACSLEVIDQMNNFNKSNVVDCIYWWGNFDVDHKQQGLQHELHSERVLNVNQKRATQDLPLLFIDEEQYSGKYAVKDMFQAICDTFPSDEQKPYACEYCTKCHDVRKCLWTLECDGEPLDTGVFHPLPAPTRRPSPYDAQFANRPSSATSLKGSSKSKSKSKSDSSSGGGSSALHQSFLSGASGISFVHVGILWGAILGLLVASFFAYRSYKRRRLVKQLANNRLRHDHDRSNAIDALVEALDTVNGDNETCSLSAPSSSSSQPPSSASSAYSDDFDDQTTNTSDGDDDEGEDEEEEEDSQQGSAMGGSSSSHNINSNNSSWEDEYGDHNNDDEDQYHDNRDEECGDSTPLTDYSSLNPNDNQGTTTTTNDWSNPFVNAGLTSYSDNPDATTAIGSRSNVPRNTYDDITSAPTMSGISFTSKKSKKKSSSTTKDKKDKDKKDKKDGKKKKKKKSKSSSSSASSSSHSRSTAASASSAAKTPMNEEEEMKWVLQRAAPKLRKEWTKQEGEFA